MKNVQMTRDCHIKKVEYPKGTIHAQKDVPADRLALWLEVGLAVETDEPVSDMASVSKNALAEKYAAEDEIKAVQAHARERARKHQIELLAKSRPKAKPKPEAKTKTKAGQKKK
jgi:hypothetical protein